MFQLGRMLAQRVAAQQGGQRLSDLTNQQMPVQQQPMQMQRNIHPWAQFGMMLHNQRHPNNQIGQQPQLQTQQMPVQSQALDQASPRGRLSDLMWQSLRQPLPANPSQGDMMRRMMGMMAGGMVLGLGNRLKR